MRTSATARFVRVSARKARLVLDEIRHRPVGEALATLQLTPRAAARLVEKVLRSAVANAEHNHQVRNLDDLRIVHATADGGPSMKRVQPRAMGRAFFIRHKTSHLTIAVSDEVNGARQAPTREAAPGRRRAEDAPARPAAETGTAPGAARVGRATKRPTGSAGKRSTSGSKPKEKT